MKNLLIGLVIGALVGGGTYHYFKKKGSLRSEIAVEHRYAFSKMSRPDKREYLLPLNNPDMVATHEADHLTDDDLVLGIVVGEHARAYPWYLMGNFHVVNDTIPEVDGYTPVFVALCEKCSGGAAFIPRVEGLEDRPLTFRVSGINFGTFEVSDHQTVSQWHPFSGECIAGPLEGKTMENLPTVLERWGTWKELHPDTLVAYCSQRMRVREHGAKTHAPGETDIPSVMAPSANLDDDRLPLNDLVYGIVGHEPQSGLALPRKELGDIALIETEFQGTPYLVVAQGELRVTAFVRKMDDEVLTFTMVSDSPIRLKDSAGTTWDEWGRALEGPRAGRRMTSARGYLTEWYEWVSGFPKTTLYSELTTVQ